MTKNLSIWIDFSLVNFLYVWTIIVDFHSTKYNEFNLVLVTCKYLNTRYRISYLYRITSFKWKLIHFMLEGKNIVIQWMFECAFLAFMRNFKILLQIFCIHLFAKEIRNYLLKSCKHSWWLKNGIIQSTGCQ